MAVSESLKCEFMGWILGYSEVKFMLKNISLAELNYDVLGILTKLRVNGYESF